MEKRKFAKTNDTEYEEEKVDEPLKIKKLIKSIKSIDFVVGCYVIVDYEGEYFPGKVIEIKKGEYKVQVMTMFGLNWKWPTTEDVFWYKKKEVVERIMPPKKMSSRNIYEVPEINSYRQ